MLSQVRPAFSCLSYIAHQALNYEEHTAPAFHPTPGASPPVTHVVHAHRPASQLHTLLMVFLSLIYSLFLQPAECDPPSFFGKAPHYSTCPQDWKFLISLQ